MQSRVIHFDLARERNLIVRVDVGVGADRRHREVALPGEMSNPSGGGFLEIGMLQLHQQAKRRFRTLCHRRDVDEVFGSIGRLVEHVNLTDEVPPHPRGAPLDVAEREIVEARRPHLVFVDDHVLRSGVDALDQGGRAHQKAQLTVVEVGHHKLREGARDPPVMQSYAAAHCTDERPVGVISRRNPIRRRVEGRGVIRGVTARQKPQNFVCLLRRLTVDERGLG